MDTTVLVGDHLLVDKLSYAPPGSISKHFCPTPSPSAATSSCSAIRIDINQNYVKRVIGVPGDRIHLWNKIVYLERQALLTEPYVAAHVPRAIDPYRDNFPPEPSSDPDVYDRARTKCSANTW